MTPEREEELLERLVVSLEELGDTMEGIRRLLDKAYINDEGKVVPWIQAVLAEGRGND